MQDIVLDSKVKIQTKKKGRWLSWFVNLVMLSLLLGLLYGLDFVLYVRSGTVNIFNGAWNPAIVWIFSVILLTAFIVMVLCCFSKKLQSFVFALLIVFLVFGFMRQFLVLNTQQYLSVLFASLFGYNALQFVEEYVPLIIGLIIFVGCYSLSMHLSNRNKAFLVGILLAVNTFLFVQAKMEKNTDDNIMQLYASSMNRFAVNGKKSVFLFMPNLTSYAAIMPSSADDFDKSELLKNVELGFFAKHGFKVFPNSYLKNNEQNNNLVELLNILDNEEFEKHILTEVEFDGFWNLEDTNKNGVYLRDNQLLDVYRKANYKINAYQSKNVEICKVNNQYIVDKCVGRHSLPFELTFSNNTDDSMSLLLKQWGLSLGIFDENLINKITQYIPLDVFNNFLLPYDGLYVVDSFDMLKRVLQDIKADKTNAVYAVYLDIPGNMFVYDEWCRIKHQDDWKANTVSSFSNSKEYNEQMLCLFGVMDNFVTALKENNNLNDDIVLVIQGLSGKNSVSLDNLNKVDKFVEQKINLTAILDKKANFELNEEVCYSKDILRSYLFNAKKCKEFSNVELSETDKQNIKNALQIGAVNQDIIQHAEHVYNEWSSKWKDNNKNMFFLPNDGVISAVSEKNNIIMDVSDAVEALNNSVVETEADVEVNEVVESEQLQEESNETVSVEKENDVVVDDIEQSNVKLESNELAITDTETAKVNENTETKEETINNEEVNTTNQQEDNKEELKQENTIDEQKTIRPQVEAISSDIKNKKTQSEDIVIEKEAKLDVVEEDKVKHEDIDVKQDNIDKNTETNKEIVSGNIKTEVGNSENKIENVSEAQDATIVGEEVTVEIDGEAVVISDYLIDGESQDEWELDPAKALGVSGEEGQVEKIIVKVK